MSSNSNNNTRRSAPDHGSTFIPLAGAGPESEAPKSLDHFKRGYRERAEMRESERYFQKSKGGDREFANAQAKRDRPMIVYGLDVNRLLDRLEDPHVHAFREIDEARQNYREAFESGKAPTALIAGAGRRRNLRVAHVVWDWLEQAQGLDKNTYHYNSMIAAAAGARKPALALDLLKEMKDKRVEKNEVTFSSAITACEKTGDWRTALDLLDNMDREGIQRTSIAYNAAISACEKGMVPQRACEVFNRMKREGIKPSVVSYSALISAAEKGSQWKLALEILEDMKRDGFHGNVIAYSATISALAKGQQWELALRLFREIQACGRQPSVVTYNATITALEKGLQWEKALDLFEEMKDRNLPITVVSYGSAISACDKGLQYRQCLEFLDEMTEMGIQKNVIIFGAAMSCMEKCCRADIGFQLMERMKLEGIAPNVHIYNSAISACARSNLWEKGYELFKEMDEVGVKRDVVTYNAVLDAVCSQVRLGRMLFEEGVKKGFYARVSRLGDHWFELDLHFLSLGGGEIAMGWWFEECLVPYLKDTEKLKHVKSISIVTGYGKTRTRGRRQGDDGMRKRCKAMLRFMNLGEHDDEQNRGRLQLDMQSLITEVDKNDGRIHFDLDSYISWKEKETTANVVPDVPQKIRARYRPEVPGSGRPPFIRVETESTSPEYLRGAEKVNQNGNGDGHGEAASDNRGGGYNSRASVDVAERTMAEGRPRHGYDGQFERRQHYATGNYGGAPESRNEGPGQFRPGPPRHRYGPGDHYGQNGGPSHSYGGGGRRGSFGRPDDRYGRSPDSRFSHYGPASHDGPSSRQDGECYSRHDAYGEPRGSRKRDYPDYERQQQQRGYNLEPDHQRRRQA